MASAVPVDAAYARALPKIEVCHVPILSSPSVPPSSPEQTRQAECLDSQPIHHPKAAMLMSSKLHAHLTGSISRQCLHDIWAARQKEDPRLTLQDPLEAIPPDKVDYDVQTYGLSSVLIH